MARNWIGRLSASLLAVALLTIAGGCGPAAAPTLAQLPGGMDAISAAYSGSGTIFVLATSPSNSDAPPTLYKKGAQDEQPIEITPQAPAGRASCADPMLLYLAPFAADHVLAMIDCGDGAGGTIATLDASGALVDVAEVAGSLNAIWSASGDLVVVEPGDDGCGQLQRFHGGHAMKWPTLPAPLTFGDGRYPACLSRTQMAYPAFVDGGVAFLAQAGSPGVPGKDRQELPWSVYALSQGGKWTAFPDDSFTDPYAVAARDGHLLIAAARSGREGLWSVDMASGEIALVESGHFIDVSVRPDNDGVVAVKYDPDANSYAVVSVAIG